MMDTIDSVNELAEAFGRLNTELLRAIELFKKFNELFVDHTPETFAVEIPVALGGDWKAINWKGEGLGVTDFDFLINQSEWNDTIHKDLQIHSLVRDEPSYFDFGDE